MNEMTQALLMLFAPPQLEDALIDWLLQQPAITGFSSVVAYGHGGRPTGMTLLEQVSGRQRRIQFMVHAEAIAAQQLVEELGRAFQGAGLHYLVLPVIDQGPI